MTDEERLDRWLERDEALARRVHILVTNTEKLRKFTEEQGRNIDKLRHLVEIDAGNIRSLAEIVRPIV